MESIYTKLALYGIKNEFVRTDTVFLPIPEVCNGTVSHVLSKANIRITFFDQRSPRADSVKILTVLIYKFFFLFQFCRKKKKMCLKYEKFLSKKSTVNDKQKS